MPQIWELILISYLLGSNCGTCELTGRRWSHRWLNYQSSKVPDVRCSTQSRCHSCLAVNGLEAGLQTEVVMLQVTQSRLALETSAKN